MATKPVTDPPADDDEGPDPEATVKGWVKEALEEGLADFAKANKTPPSRTNPPQGESIWQKLFGVS